MTGILLILVEVSLLAAAQLLGGSPWTVLTALAIVLQSLAGLTVAGLGRLAIAFAWLALFVATGNRELFFCFTMTLAAASAMLSPDSQWRRGSLAGGLIVAVFLAFRVAQSATLKVLAVEAAVAVVILAAALLARHHTCRTTANPIAHELALTGIVTASGLAAYAGLAL